MKLNKDYKFKKKITKSTIIINTKSMLINVSIFYTSSKHSKQHQQPNERERERLNIFR